MNVKKSALVTFVCLILSILSFAQKNELSFSVGAIHSSDQTESLRGVTCIIGGFCGPINTSTSTGVAFAGSYARQLFNFHAGSLDLELPLMGAPGRDVKVSALGITLPGLLSTSTFFFTPSARIKLLPSAPISPFFCVGGGLAHTGTHFNISSIGILGVPVPAISVSNSNNSGALQFGGGVDFKTPLPHLAIRGEVRDFWAVGFASPSSALQVSPARQHNIFAGGGVVFRF